MATLEELQQRVLDLEAQIVQKKKEIVELEREKERGRDAVKVALMEQARRFGLDLRFGEPHKARRTRGSVVPGFMTVNEAAQRAGITRTTAYRLVKEGRIKGEEVKGQIRVSEEALQEYLARVAARRGHISQE